MALITLDEYNKGSAKQADNSRIRGFSVHSDLIAGVLTNKTEEKIGTVANALLDDTGHIQYIVIDLGVNPSGRQVLLPADRVRTDYDQQRVYAGGMTKDQAEFLPEFNVQDLSPNPQWGSSADHK